MEDYDASGRWNPRDVLGNNAEAGGDEPASTKDVTKLGTLVEKLAERMASWKEEMERRWDNSQHRIDEVTTRMDEAAEQRHSDVRKIFAQMKDNRDVAGARLGLMTAQLEKRMDEGNERARVGVVYAIGKVEERVSEASNLAR